MPITTDNGKLALMELDQDWEPGLPLSPGTLEEDDQQQLLWGFPEISWSGSLLHEGTLLHLQDEYLGRFQQGQEVPFVLQCTGMSGNPDDPQYPPAVTIYQDANPPVLMETRLMAASERGVVAGLFRLPRFLVTGYDAGRYLVVFRWTDSDGEARMKVASFTVNPGGSADGAVISMHHVVKPEAGYLIWQTDAGWLVRGKNPR